MRQRRQLDSLRVIEIVLSRVQSVLITIASGPITEFPPDGRDGSGCSRCISLEDSETLRIAASSLLPSLASTPVSTTRIASFPTRNVEELALPSLSEMYTYKPGPICLGVGDA